MNGIASPVRPLALRWSAVFLVFAAAAALWLSAPAPDGFLWADAPRHAMNAVLLADALRELPLSRPVQWVFDYYLTWPALSIFFYPPLFYLVSVPFVLAFGVSESVSLVPVALHAALLGLAIAAIVRPFLGEAGAAGAALLLLGAPAVALWARQVMLEIPSAAYPALAAACLLAWLRDGRRTRLWAGTAALAAAVWTKLSTVYALPLLPLAAWLRLGPAAIRDRDVRRAHLALALAVLPWVPHQLLFGRHNLANVAGASDLVLQPSEPLSWIWYLLELPRIGGVLITCLVVLLVLRLPSLFRDGSLGRDVPFLLGWFLFAYVFFSFVALKEDRQGLHLLAPLAALGLLALSRTLVAPWAGRLALLLGAAGFAYGLMVARAPAIQGYREAAATAAALARPNSTVLVSGERDGTLAFWLRASGRDDVAVLRADKLLLEVDARRTLGVKEAPWSEEEIAERLAREGVDLVLAQAEFWTDLAVMARLERVLRSERFVEIARIPIRAVPHRPLPDRELVLYRARAWRPPEQAPVRLKIPLVGIEIEGLPRNRRTAAPSS
ncbi:MAG: glycosyltransferase family 39 protein [Geminicoccaceae bacterium]|nr:glycosyltransferase family 39 protein [Geminicoccaceae bacterium]